MKNSYQKNYNFYSELVSLERTNINFIIYLEQIFRTCGELFKIILRIFILTKYFYLEIII